VVERTNPTPGAAGERPAPELGGSGWVPAARPPRWRPRWSAAVRRRPPWWEVPPQGYLEVESRNSPTSPRALRATARAAVKAGLSWDPGSPLPVQRFVQSQERARLIFQARRELPRVTAVASQVLLVDRRLAQAEEALRQAVGHRSAAAAAQGGATAQPATGPQPIEAAEVASGRPSGADRPGRPTLLGPWSEAAILAVIAGGQAVLSYTAARDGSLAAPALGLLAGAVAVGSIVAAQLAARGIHQLGAGAEGLPDPSRRRRLDVAVAGGALACGVTLTVAVGQLGRGAGASALGLALLGLATAASYAATPHGGSTASPWRSLADWLRGHQQRRRRRRRLRAARASEAGAQVAAQQLREELAVLVPQLFAAEQSALLFWRYQVAIGDATQHGFEQQLAAYSMRRPRGIWRPITDWWRGTPLAPSTAGEAVASIGEDQPDWSDQVARVTTAAKRVLVRRGLLDITHGLRLPSVPGVPAADHNGHPARSDPDPAAGDGHRPTATSNPDRSQPGHKGS
jgi:hypothetical protein